MLVANRVNGSVYFDLISTIKSSGEFQVYQVDVNRKADIDSYKVTGSQI